MNPAKRFWVTMTIVALMFLSAGCAQLRKFGADQRMATYRNVYDKAMVDAFYQISDDGMKEGLNDSLRANKYSLEGLGRSFICMKDRGANAANMGMASAGVGSGRDSVADIVAETYISVAKSRGGIVRLYKPRLCGVINKLVRQPFSHAQNTREWYDVDNALVEYGKSGEIVSFLVRAHQAFVMIGATRFEYSTVFFGPEASRILENNVPNSAFEDNFIRNM